MAPIDRVGRCCCPRLRPTRKPTPSVGCFFALNIICAVCTTAWVYASIVHSSCQAQERAYEMLGLTAWGHGQDSPCHAIETTQEAMLSRLTTKDAASDGQHSTSPIAATRPHGHVNEHIGNHREPVEEKLHVIITVSNAASYESRWMLSTEMIRRLRTMEHAHVEVYVAELAYGNQSYSIAETGNPKHLQLRTKMPLWHKENLINLAVERLLPPDWKAVAWIDSEVEFESPTWALDTLKLLHGPLDILQLFSHALDLGPDGTPQRIYTGFAYNSLRDIAYQKQGADLWHPGYAWACTRQAYEQIGGLFEGNILGGGDQSFAYAAAGMHKHIPAGQQKIFPTSGYHTAVLEWETRFQGLRMGHVPGVVRHRFHGTAKDRRYWERRALLARAAFDPHVHIARDALTGVIAPTPSFPTSLVKGILKYFSSRNEDGVLSPTQKETFPSSAVSARFPSCSVRKYLTQEFSIADADALHVFVIARPAHDGQSADGMLWELLSNLDATPHARVHLMEVPDRRSGRYDHVEASPRSPPRIPLSAGEWEDTMGLALNSLLSPNATHVAFVEAGLLLESSTWVNDTLKLLKQNVYEVVQLFGLLANLDGATGGTRETSTSLGYDTVHRSCTNTTKSVSLEDASRKTLVAYAFDVKDAGSVRDYLTKPAKGSAGRSPLARIHDAGSPNPFRIGYVPGVARRIS